MTPLIDVVIPTRDRPEALIACLEALARQTLQDFHVIVVDDGSVAPVAEALPIGLQQELQITVLRHSASRGPAAARNRAIRHGHAPYIAFVDDDVRCAPDLLEQHVWAIRQTDDQHISIGPLSAPADWEPTPWNHWEALQVATEYDRMADGAYTPTWRQFHTGNAFLARRTIEATGLFDERFTRAEDVEFALRAALRGYRFVFNPDAVGWHYAYRTRAAWLRIPRAYATFDVLLASMHPQLHWLETIHRERQRRHAILRAARYVGRIPRVRPVVVAALISAAALLHGWGGVRMPMGLLSIAYDLEYDAAQRQSRAGADGSEAPAVARETLPAQRVQLP